LRHIECALVTVTLGASIHPSDNRINWVMKIHLCHMLRCPEFPTHDIGRRSQAGRGLDGQAFAYIKGGAPAE
jgi:hypothetical protein